MQPARRRLAARSFNGWGGGRCRRRLFGGAAGGFLVAALLLLRGKVSPLTDCVLLRLSFSRLISDIHLMFRHA